MFKKIYSKYSRAIISWCLPKDLNTEPQPLPCLSFKSGDTGEGGNWGIPGSNGSGGEKRLSAPRGWLFAVERSLDMFFFNDIFVSIPKKKHLCKICCITIMGIIIIDIWGNRDFLNVDSMSSFIAVRSYCLNVPGPLLAATRPRVSAVSTQLCLKPSACSSSGHVSLLDKKTEAQDWLSISKKST